MASAGLTAAPRCANISKWTRRTSSYASLQALAEEGAVDKGTLKAALNKLGLDANKLDPQKA